MRRITRRRFVEGAAAAAAVGMGARVHAQAQGPNRVGGFDHVALPMLNADAMIAFYRKLGFDMRESAAAVSVYIGRSMINFHRATRCRMRRFTLRAPAARPPCGDLCFVWDGTAAQLKPGLTLPARE